MLEDGRAGHPKVGNVSPNRTLSEIELILITSFIYSPLQHDNEKRKVRA
jgi:hypothetical protein